MALGIGSTLAPVGHSREMPQDAADYLAKVVKPRREAIGSQTDAAKQWGVSQSHISQIENGAGCGVAVLFTLRRKLGLSLEELCFPPEKRLPSGREPVLAPAPALNLDAIRDVVRAELAQAQTPSTIPPDSVLPPKKGLSNAPRPRRR